MSQLLDQLVSRGIADVSSSLGKSAPAAARGGAGGANTRSWRTAALSRADPLLQFDWDIHIQVGGLTHRPEFVENIVVPGTTVEAEPIYRAGSRVYIATVHNVGAVSMRLYEDIQMSSTKFLRSWFGLIVKPNGDHGLPVEYKGVIEVYPTDARGTRVAKIKCINVFPTQNPPLTFGSENERQSLDVEFSCDVVEYEFYK